MARIRETKCSLCRREGMKLFLKGARCLTNKCPLEKRGAVPPGVHGSKRKGRISDYGQQLRAKQRAKRLYQVSEKQFRRYVEKAKKAKEMTGEALMQALETRLDNLVFRLGFAPNRPSSRQLVSHRHILVNGKKVNIPSYQVKVGEVITFVPHALKIPSVETLLAQKEANIPAWLERKAAVGTLKRLPKREEIEADIDDSSIIEYYSR